MQGTARWTRWKRSSRPNWHTCSWPRTMRKW
uniref:Uncharacterized protein n=1 Tax=Arundo donax TaxID=35708 RepID=A0A0A9G173_ARUDO